MSLLRAVMHKPKSKHAKPSAAAPVIVAGGLTASFAAVDAAALASSASAASANDFARLRQCESGGNYAINTGNGFYGAYQFDLGTWHGLGYSGKPNNAAPATQDAAAKTLQSERGWSPWPGCSRKLGLTGGGGHAAPQAASRGTARTARPTTRTTVRPTAAPAFPGHVLSVSLAKTARGDVLAWQHRMAARGWDIAADGHFGPQSAAVAARFAKEKHINVSPGRVDAAVWRAAWTAPLN